MRPDDLSWKGLALYIAIMLLAWGLACFWVWANYVLLGMLARIMGLA